MGVLTQMIDAKKIAAMESLTALEKHFAALRDRFAGRLLPIWLDC